MNTNSIIYTQLVMNQSIMILTHTHQFFNSIQDIFY